MSKHNRGRFDATITVLRDGDDGDEVSIEVEVSGDVTAFRPGKTTGPAELCYPDEGGEVEVTGSWVKGEEFELTHEEISDAEESLQRAAADATEDAAVDRYEYQQYTRDL